MPYQYTIGGATPCDQHGIPFAAEVPPLSTEVLNGYANTDGQTILTIPANTTVKVAIQIVASLNATKASAAATVTLTGTGSPSPATGATLAAVGLATSSGNPNAAAASVLPGIWIYSGTSTVTLKLNYGGMSYATAVVNGYVVT